MKNLKQNNTTIVIGGTLLCSGLTIAGTISQITIPESDNIDQYKEVCKKKVCASGLYASWSVLKLTLLGEIENTISGRCPVSPDPIKVLVNNPKPSNCNGPIKMPAFW